MPAVIADSLKARLLAAVAGNNLILLCGAGLSMAPPSRLPSAWAVSQRCAEEYRKITGDDLPSGLSDNIELVAEFFFNRKEFQSVFIEQLVDWPVFVKGTPNQGHEAVADFLAAHVVPLAISANVDMLIELAASQLGEPDFYPVVFANDLNRMTSMHSPLIKLHGCATKSRFETVWCKDQIEETVVKTRLGHLASWVQGPLVNRDLLIVGFWTDWRYLNQIFEQMVVSTEPRSIILVDPDEERNLEAKSPDLWAWAKKNSNFIHVRASGDEFLSELRHIVSCHFLRKVWKFGSDAYDNFMATSAPAEPTSALAALSNSDLYRLRRDLTMTPLDAVVRRKEVDGAYAIIGVIHLALVACGARFSGSIFEWNGTTIRLVFAPLRPLSAVMHLFSEEPPDPVPAARTICVGAIDDGGAPAHLVRKGRVGGVIRVAPSGSWETEKALLDELRKAVPR